MSTLPCYKVVVFCFFLIILSLQTNQFIDIKNITFLIDKNIFDYQFKLKNDNNLQIIIEKISTIKNSNNYGLKEIKSIEFCIEFLITNNKTIYENLDETQQINALIQWNLEISLPRFHHSHRNYSLNTTLLIQKSNLLKILPIIEVFLWIFFINFCLFLFFS